LTRETGFVTENMSEILLSLRVKSSLSMDGFISASKIDKWRISRPFSQIDSSIN